MKEYNYCPLCGKELTSGIVDGRKRRYCPHCDFIHYINPLPSAGAVAIKEGKILLIKRGREPGKGSWAPPSGFVESGETPEAACLRELKEETGVDGRIGNLLGVYHERTDFYGDVLIIMYSVEILNDELTPGDDAEYARFFAINDLPDVRFNCFKEAITEALEKLHDKFQSRR